MLKWLIDLDVRKVGVVLSIFIAVALPISTGKVPLDHVFPDVAIPFVVAWAGFLGFIASTVLAAHNTAALMSPRDITSAIKAVIMLFAVMFLFAMPTPAFADPAVRKPPQPLVELGGPCNPLGDSRPECQAQGSPAPGGTVANPSLCDATTFIQLNPKNVVTILQSCGEKLLADSQAGLASATAKNDQIAMGCLGPGTDLVTAAVGTPAVPAVEAVPANGTTPAIPAQPAKPAVIGGPILIFQKFREFVNAGGITNCMAWVNNTVTAASLPIVGGVAGVAAGAALLAPK